MAGKYFEEFEVGQTFVHEIRRTVTDMDNILFSALTYNPAAIHIDHEYAKTTEFGKPLINSIFTLGLMVGLSVQDTTLGTTAGNLGGEEIERALVAHAHRRGRAADRQDGADLDLRLGRCRCAKNSDGRSGRQQTRCHPTLPAGRSARRRFAHGPGYFKRRC